MEGATEVRLFGEKIQVRAQILQLPGMSGHADREGLLQWIEHIQPKPTQVYVNHGGDEVCDEFAQMLCERGFDAKAPYPGSQYDLVTGEVLEQGNRVQKQLEDEEETGASRASAVFQRLVQAGKRLMTVIGHNRGGANKDLAKFCRPDSRPLRKVGQIVFYTESRQRIVIRCLFFSCLMVGNKIRRKLPRQCSRCGLAYVPRR